MRIRIWTWTRTWTSTSLPTSLNMRNNNTTWTRTWTMPGLLCLYCVSTRVRFRLRLRFRFKFHYCDDIMYALCFRNYRSQTSTRPLLKLRSPQSFIIFNPWKWIFFRPPGLSPDPPLTPQSHPKVTPKSPQSHPESTPKPPVLGFFDLIWPYLSLFKYM